MPCMCSFQVFVPAHKVASHPVFHCQCQAESFHSDALFCVCLTLVPSAIYLWCETFPPSKSYSFPPVLLQQLLVVPFWVATYILVHLDLTFVNGERQWSNFILLCLTISVTLCNREIAQPVLIVNILTENKDAGVCVSLLFYPIFKVSPLWLSLTTSITKTSSYSMKPDTAIVLAFFFLRWFWLWRFPYASILIFEQGFYGVLVGWRF